EPEGSQLRTSWAATGSVTAAKTTGTDLVLATTASADGVAMATITSGLSPTNLRAICPAVAVLPWAVWYCHLRLSPLLPAASSAARTPSRTESSAGCSTMAVAATDLVSATTLENGVARAIAKAPRDNHLPIGDFITYPIGPAAAQSDFCCFQVQKNAASCRVFPIP